MIKGPETKEYLANIIFDFRPLWGLVTEEEREDFEVCFGFFYWALHMTGRLICEYAFGAPERIFKIDLEDERTLNSFLALIHSKDPGHALLVSSWGMDVFDDSLNPVERDKIIYPDGEFVLEGYRDAYNFSLSCTEPRWFGFC